MSGQFSAPLTSASTSFVSAISGGSLAATSSPGTGSAASTVSTSLSSPTLYSSHPLSATGSVTSPPSQPVAITSTLTQTLSAPSSGNVSDVQPSLAIQQSSLSYRSIYVSVSSPLTGTSIQQTTTASLPPVTITHSIARESASVSVLATSSVTSTPLKASSVADSMTHATATPSGSGTSRTSVSFFDNRGAVIGTFAAVGIVVAAPLAILCLLGARRLNQRKREALRRNISWPVQPFDDNHDGQPTMSIIDSGTVSQSFTPVYRDPFSDHDTVHFDSRGGIGLPRITTSLEARNPIPSPSPSTPSVYLPNLPVLNDEGTGVGSVSNFRSFTHLTSPPPRPSRHLRPPPRSAKDLDETAWVPRTSPSVTFIDPASPESIGTSLSPTYLEQVVSRSQKLSEGSLCMTPLFASGLSLNDSQLSTDITSAQSPVHDRTGIAQSDRDESLFLKRRLSYASRSGVWN